MTAPSPRRTSGWRGSRRSPIRRAMRWPCWASRSSRNGIRRRRSETRRSTFFMPSSGSVGDSATRYGGCTRHVGRPREVHRFARRRGSSSDPDPVNLGRREFTVVSDGHYQFALPLFGIRFDANRLRWDHHELVGELAVSCEIPGAKTLGDGSLSRANLNFSVAAHASGLSEGPLLPQ